MSLLQNADDFLTIPTHDGSGSVVHPSVIDFNDHGLENWNGYRYWMLMTPYPSSNDAHEDPNIVVSHDGLAWSTHPQITNPLNNAPGSPGAYNNDTELVFDPDQDRLMCYYCRADNPADGGGDYDSLFLIILNSDLSLVPEQEIIPTPFVDRLLSPSIWRESATRWHLWHMYRPGTEAENHQIVYRFSTDGINWSGLTVCNDITRTAWPGYYPWHLAAKYNPWENRIEFLLNMNPNGGSAGEIVHFVADPATPTTLTALTTEKILVRSVSGWDNNRIYRATFTIENNQGEYLYRVWYSAYGDTTTYKWNVGYTQGYLGVESAQPQWVETQRKNASGSPSGQRKKPNGMPAGIRKGLA